MENPENKNELLFENKDKKQQEPGIHQKTGGIDPNTKKKFSFSLLYVIFIILLFIILNKVLYTSNIHTVNIDYSTFKQYIADGKIQQVVFNNEEYLGYSMTKAEASSLLSEYAQKRQIPKTVDSSLVTV